VILQYGTPTPTPDKAQRAYQQQQRGMAGVPSRSILGGAADLQEQERLRKLHEQQVQTRDRISLASQGPPFDDRAAFQRGVGQQPQAMVGRGQQQQQLPPAQPLSYPLPKFAQQQQQQGVNQQGEGARLLALQTKQQVQQLVIQQQQQQQHLSESKLQSDQGHGHGGGVDARRPQQFVAQAPQPGHMSEDDFETTTVGTESDMQVRSLGFRV